MQEKSIRNLLIFSFLGYLTYTLKNVLTPFLIALFIAYLLNPLIAFIEEKFKIKKRGVSVTIGIVSTLVLLTAITLLSFPTINKEFHKASTIIKDYAEFIPPIPNEIQNQITSFIHSDQLKELIDSNTIGESISKITPLLKSIFSESISLLIGVFNIFLILIYLVFILQGYPKLSKNWLNWIPIQYRQSVNGISNDLNDGMRSYFRGQALIALIVGILFCIGFSIINLPLAILLGIFIGTLNLVPYLQILGFIPALFLSILHSMENGQGLWLSIGATALVFLIIQIIQESILIPKIMNKVTGLHPAIILLALSIWGSLLGFAGLILALPITTLILSYYKRFINKEIS